MSFNGRYWSLVSVIKFFELRFIPRCTFDTRCYGKNGLPGPSFWLRRHLAACQCQTCRLPDIGSNRPSSPSKNENAKTSKTHRFRVLAILLLRCTLLLRTICFNMNWEGLGGTKISAEFHKKPQELFIPGLFERGTIFLITNSWICRSSFEGPICLVEKVTTQQGLQLTPLTLSAFPASSFCAFLGIYSLSHVFKCVTNESNKTYRWDMMRSIKSEQ